MRYYPKRGVGFELSHFNIDNLDDFETQLDNLRAEESNEEADALEERGPDGVWNAAILTAIRDWSGDHYDDAVFDEIHSWHEVTPMWIGELRDERGGEISGVRGFDSGVEYLIFDKREQDTDKWAAFTRMLKDAGIELVSGEWAQLG